MIKKFVVSMLLFLSSFAPALEMPQFVEILKNQHPFFAAQKAGQEIRQVERQALFAITDWRVDIDGRYTDDGGRNLNAFAARNEKTVTSRIGRKFFQSGGDLALGHQWRESADSEQNQQFTLDYTHPLLRDKDGINTRLPLDLATIDIEIGRLEKTEAEEAFILSAVKKFVDLAYLQAREKINRKRRELSRQELELTRKKFAASIVDQVDVLRQQDAFLRASEQLLQSQRQKLALEQELLTLLGSALESLAVDFDLYAEPAIAGMDVKDALATRSRAVRSITLAQQKLHRQQQSRENESEATLNLKTGVASTSGDTVEDDHNYYLGLNFSYPLGAIENRAALEKIALDMARLENDKQAKIRELLARAKALKSQLKILKDILAANRLQIKAAEQKTKEERMRYQNSRGEATFVIQAQNNEQSAHLAYAENAKDYQHAWLEWLALIDRLHDA